jgi:threonylcarbamoyladenosine tRNA methylthiotransferase MtaB
MPLQSGNNDILRLMKRRYLRELYAERVQTIRNLIPHACIGVDVITGFPGESDQHFIDTHQFLADLDIDYIHA